jgi:hypothetical protein
LLKVDLKEMQEGYTFTVNQKFLFVKLGRAVPVYSFAGKRVISLTSHLTHFKLA